MSGSPKEMIDFLVSLDPPFETELEAEALEELTHHQVMMIFARYFSSNQASFSTKQLRRFGEWLNASVAAGGVVENAVSTCLLEHSRQLKVNRILAPYLSPLAKARSHA